MKRLIAFLVASCLVALSAQAQLPPGNTGITINQTLVAGGVNGDCLTVSAGKVGQTATCGAAAGLTIGTSPITGGTTTRILYDNAGVVGEYTLTGSGTVVAMQTAPTFLTSVTSPLFTTNAAGAANAPIFNFGTTGIYFSGSNGSFSVSTNGTNALTIATSGQATFAGTVVATGSLSTTDGRVSQASGPIMDMRTTNTFKFFQSDNSTKAAVEVGGLNSNNATVIFSALASDATHTDNTVCVDASNGTLYKGSGTVGICLGTSSARYKRDIVPLQAGLAEVMRLEPVTYHYLPGYGDGGQKRLYGFTAEQTYGVLPEIVGLDVYGRPNAIDWAALVPVLVRAVQQQDARIVALEAR